MPGPGPGPHRAQLCKAIASLSPDATAEEVEDVIGPIVRSFLDENGAGRAPVNNNNEHDDDGVTPFMVACDKAQLAVLEYFRESIQSNTNILQLAGSPTDSSSAGCGGNCAVHHAASVGSIVAIDCLGRIQMELSPRSHTEHLLDLLSQRNSNGDTPIMMAAASGQETLIRHFVHKLLNESDNVMNTEKDVSSEVRRLFQMSNDSGDTACSLASGFGFHEIILLLIEPAANDDCVVVQASHGDLERSREALRRMDNLLPMVKKKGSKKEQEEFSAKRSDISRCVEIIEAALDREAQKQMGELLGEEDISTVVNSSKTSSKRKAKKKKKGREITKKFVPKNEDENLDGSEESSAVTNGIKGQTKKQAWKVSRTQLTDQSHESEALSSPRVVTLQDGTVIATNDRTTYDVAVGDSSAFASKSLGEETKKVTDKSISDMLRDRCRERRVQAEVEAIMDSLCLDPTMLLLSSHGMALDLSPCQLEAVESILKMQMTAIGEAKTIQARIRSTSEENSA
mmetsp:Transcript_6762/g.18875  ORF Transcript_6762/g.18875 Transcript_6762/m.18875 type:complete len:513 (+) Transcript_6762:114-1652(+)